jgi:Helix-turn-helix domain
MEREELLNMSQREVDRLKAIQQVLDRTLKQKQAARQLGLSARQVRRLCHRVRVGGNRGTIHGLRGKPSNHQLAAGLLDKALRLVETKYSDFGPTLANEKLRQIHRIQMATSTLRRGMTEAGLWQSRPQPAKHRAWRQRRACRGELVQLDGSHHAWLEERGPACVLVAYIDDATSEVLYAEFVASEDTRTLLATTRSYLQRHGRPVAFYVDRDSIYRVNRQASLDEQLRDGQPLTQFSRAMQELGIEIIAAHSPQAKGRVERLFSTLQDRLVKELRLHQMATLEQANRFLWEHYLPSHNARFACEPLSSNDAHRPLPASQVLEEVLSVRTDRTLMQDFTLRFQNQLFQLSAEQPVRLRPKDKITVETRLDGTVHLRWRQQYLNFQLIAAKLTAGPAGSVQPLRAPKVHQRYKPAATHPWRRGFRQKINGAGSSSWPSASRRASPA